MQTSHSLPSAQLPLFQEAFWASNGAPLLDDVIDSPSSASIEEPAAFSELSLSGLPGHCLTLLAPILRELQRGTGCPLADPDRSAGEPDP